MFGLTWKVGARRRLGDRGPRTRFVPRLELLECRTLPSTFTVLNLADSGAGSLRQAVFDANAHAGANVIDFAPGLSGTITLTSGQLSITNDLTIDGPGADKLAVSGNDASRVFRVSSSITVDIDDLTITHGRADNGGGIWNAGGILGLTHVMVSQNQALGAPGSRADGGGVFNTGALTVDHSTFSANVVVGGPRVDATVTTGQGGGLASRGDGATLLVSYSTFSDNQAIGGAGGPGLAGSNGAGGGLWNSSTLTVAHSTFTHNLALGGAGGTGQAAGNGNGGGLNNNNNTLASVDDSTFTDNLAIGGVGGAGGAGGAGNGGGLLNVVVNNTAGVALSLTHSTFSGNQALGGAAGAGGDGGDSRGGGALNFISTGGGPAALTVSHSTFTDNLAIGGNGAPGRLGGGAFGGGIMNLGGNNFNATLTVTHSTFADNRATGGRGGTGAAGGNGQGGGIASAGSGFGIAGRATLNLSDSVLEGNQATGGAGGAGGNGGEGRGGGITSGMFSLSTISHTTLADNQAVGGQGGDGGNGGNGLGGGLYVDAGNDTVSLEHDRITDNQAVGGAGGNGGTDGQGVGGGLYIASGTVVADHTKIKDNHASTSDDDVFGNLLLSGFTLGPLVQVSRGDPFAGCTADDVEHQPGILTPSAGTEPRLAVDPTDPNHLVGVFQQDRWSNGANRGVIAEVSFDGGRRWREIVIPGFSLCSGGDFHRAGDPWVSFAPNGDLYFSAIGVDKGPSGLNARTAVFASKSTDGGLTWTFPVTIDVQFPAETGRQGDDFPVITADRTDPQIAYVVWSVDRNTELFSRTTDGGRTWEPGRIIYDPGPGPIVFANPVVVQPDGTLIDFLHVTNPGADPELLLLRSSDRGQTWTPQTIRLATQQYVALTDPDTGQLVVDGFPGTASDVGGDPSNGNLYAVWEDGRFNGRQHDAIAFSMSTDGGLTWSEPIQINQTPTGIDPGDQQAFLPTIQVAQDGTVGVTYYDFRFNDAQPGLATDYWFVHAHPDDPGGLTNPANWAHELRLTNKSFDLERAPNTVRGFFVGDYEGLAAAGNSFRAFWAQPGETDPANIFFRRIDKHHHRRDGGDDDHEGEIARDFVLQFIAASGVPERKHEGFLQDGSFSQAVDLLSSNYVLGFGVPQRGIYPESSQPFPVRIDRSIAGTFTASGIAPAVFRVASFPVMAGARPVPLEGFNPDEGDDTVWIDQFFLELA
jgi:hypothetical protein